MLAGGLIPVIVNSAVAAGVGAIASHWVHKHVLRDLKSSPPPKADGK